MSIIGSTAKTYRLAEADEGRALTVEVTHVITTGTEQGVSKVLNGVITVND